VFLFALNGRRCLSVDECIPKYKLLALQILVFFREFTPLLCKANLFGTHSLFKRTQLL